MILFSPRQVGRAFCAVCCFACLVFTPRAAATLPRQTPSAAQDSAKQSRESGPPLRIPRQQAQPTAAALPFCGACRDLRHRIDADTAYIENISPDTLPPVADVYNTVPNRWALEQPDYHRYSQRGEYIYTKPRWYDPFNRNRFKGDEPIWPKLLGQQTFLNITASSESFFDDRRVPSPSNVSSARAGSSGFFGKGEQAFFDQTLRFTLDFRS